MLQVPGKFIGRRVAVLRLAFERAVNHFLQLGRDLRIGFAGRNGTVHQAVIHDGEWIRPLERRLARQHLVQNDTQ